MPETAALNFSYQELAEMMVKKAGIREGFWGVNISLNLQGCNTIGPAGKPVPAAMVSMPTIGLVRVPELNDMAVDAAKVWEEEEAGFLEKISSSE